MKSNHEIWRKCTNCGSWYDFRKSEKCDECGTKIDHSGRAKVFPGLKARKRIYKSNPTSLTVPCLQFTEIRNENPLKKITLSQ